jgi:ion channel-forming bestrophin family protein
MYVRRNVRASIIFWFCWKQLLFFILLSSMVYWMHSHLHWQWLAVPYLPVGTIGTAVAFYVGFKNNASYERLWEGRKIWDSITTLCRSWAILVTAIGSANQGARAWNAVEQRMIRRQIAWCNLLRIQLRQTTGRRNVGKVPDEVGLVDRVYQLGDSTKELESCIEEWVPEIEREALKSKTNAACELLRLQSIEISQLRRDGLIADLEAEQLQAVTLGCLKEQGGSERLKSFPFPRQYAYFSAVFVWIFMILLPFSLIGDLAKAGEGLDWMVVPFSTLISWIFLTMEQVGDTSEDPFEMGLNDIPLTALCRSIEIELLEMAGEKQLPAQLLAVADILL